uniref:Gasdermin E n=1 Tax=Pseudonaja textilis TaxID=8673 RepID=A0A670ZEP1_PSETE
MFAKATKTFVKEVDCGGDLISVSSLNILDKIEFLNLVTKKKKTWCWQNPKYHLSSVSLNDLLAQDMHGPIKPVIVESDFVKYESKFEDCIRGSVDTSVGRINLGSGGSNVVEGLSSFGNLKKQEVDLLILIYFFSFRSINLQASLLEQMLERKSDVLCILTEKILTTQKCLISEHIQKEEKIAGMVGINAKIIKVSVNENGNIIKNSNVVLEIPASTAIAYGIIELYVKRDGQFDVLQLKTQFQPFINLSEEKQRALYQMICDLLLHEETVMQLENVLVSLCSERSPGIISMEELQLPEKPCLEEFLQLVGVHLQSKCQIYNKELFLAAHFLLSALAELSSYSLMLLLACCDLQLVPTLCFLPNMTLEDGTVTLADPVLAPLADPGKFQIAQKLFALSNINLEMTESSIKAVTMKKNIFSPIVLYIALNGLHALGYEKTRTDEAV